MKPEHLALLAGILLLMDGMLILLFVWIVR